MKRILIAPLNWGLGHATRCVPIIQEIETLGMQPVLAGEGRSAALLCREFPHLEFISLPGFEIRYPENGNMTIQMLLALPAFLKSIRAEHRLLEKIIAEKQIDAVISDNRYGLYSKQVPCIFITHQVFIQAPLGAALLLRINERYMRRFTECWIPDYAGKENLSGILSHGGETAVQRYFIGPLSRLRTPSGIVPVRYDLLVILSGPEPQRTVLERLVKRELEDVNLRVLLILGKTEQEEYVRAGNVEERSHLSAAAMQEAWSQSALVLCRSGYSSIMDAEVMGSKCIFIPTPGQTEQEYLGTYHAGLGHAITVTQDAFKLRRALEEASLIPGFKSRKEEGEVRRGRLLNLSGLL
ncbi:MAG TPA: glycosyltransferase [Bacteroidia bacterium]|nr:glycosyltransferase [Bacteroidia bacterium]